jgi:hypothetical protein
VRAGRCSGASHGWLDATTSQGGQFQMEIDGDRPLRMSVDLRMSCPAGEWRISWSPHDHSGRAGR